MQALLGFSKIVDRINHHIGVVAYWLIPTMVLVGVWNVFARFFGQAIEVSLTSNLLIELQWYIFSLTIFMGAPYNLLHNEHVRVDVLYDRQNNRRRAWINIIGAVFILIPFCLLIIYFAWDFIGNSWAILEDSPDPSGLPRYPIKTVIAVGMFLLALQGASEAIKNFAFLRGQPGVNLESFDPHARGEGSIHALDEPSATPHPERRATDEAPAAEQSQAPGAQQAEQPNQPQHTAADTTSDTPTRQQSADTTTETDAPSPEQHTHAESQEEKP